MKLLTSLLLFAAIPLFGAAPNLPISQLPGVTSVAATDLLLITINPGGTPASRKATLSAVNNSLIALNVTPLPSTNGTARALRLEEDLTIGTSIRVTNAATGEFWDYAATGTNAFARLKDITNHVGSITIGSLGAGTSLVGTPSGIAFKLLSLIPGLNVTITNNNNQIGISAAQTGETNLLGSVGTGTSIAGTKSGLTLNVKSIAAGNAYLNIAADSATLTLAPTNLTTLDTSQVITGRKVFQDTGNKVIALGTVSTVTNVIGWSTNDISLTSATNIVLQFSGSAPSFGDQFTRRIWFTQGSSPYTFMVGTNTVSVDPTAGSSTIVFVSTFDSGTNLIVGTTYQTIGSSGAGINLLSGITNGVPYFKTLTVGSNMSYTATAYEIAINSGAGSGAAAGDYVTTTNAQAIIGRKTFQDTASDLQALGSVSGTVTVSWATNTYSLTAAGNVAFAFSGSTPTTAKMYARLLIFKQDSTGSRTLTIGGTNITVDPGANATTMVMVSTVDSGTTLYAATTYKTLGASGSGTSLLSTSTNGQYYTRTLIAGPGISITNNADQIGIEATGSSDPYATLQGNFGKLTRKFAPAPSSGTIASNSPYQAWPVMFAAPDTNLLYLFFGGANTHLTTNSVLYMTTSTNGGASWAANSVSYTNFPYDVRSTAVGADTRGRVFAITELLMGTNNGLWSNTICRVSDDHGSTWTQISTLTHPNTNFGNFRPFGRIIEQNGVLICPSFLFKWSDTTVREAYCLRSWDSGTNWSATVISTNKLLTSGGEPTIAALGNGRLYCNWRITQNVAYGRYGFATSEDNGATWTFNGYGVTQTPSVQSNPADMVMDDNGNLLLGFCDRQSQVIYYMSLPTIMLNNSTNWNMALTNLLDRPTPGGYVSMVYGGNNKMLLAYYDEPALATPPANIIVTNISISPMFTGLQILADIPVNRGINMRDVSGGYFDVVQASSVDGVYQTTVYTLGVGNSSSIFFVSKRSSTATDGSTGTPTVRFRTFEADGTTPIGDADIAYKFENGTTNLLTMNGKGNLTVTGNITTTNGFIVIGNGGLKLAGGTTVTNFLSGSATLNFASQTLGGNEELPITVTGAADGDEVLIGVPVGSISSIIGSFTGFASNGVVFVKFTSTGTTQDPASGTFKAMVIKH